MDSTLWLVYFVKNTDTENVMHRGKTVERRGRSCPVKTELGGPKPRNTAAAAENTEGSCPPRLQRGHGLADTRIDIPSLQSATHNFRMIQATLVLPGWANQGD